MTSAEIVGPSIHDGMRMEVPETAKAFVMITRDQDGYLAASLAVRQGCEVGNDELADILTDLVLRLPDG